MNIKKYCRLILLVFKGKSSVKKGSKCSLFCFGIGISCVIPGKNEKECFGLYKERRIKARKIGANVDRNFVDRLDFG